ncbi:MAG: alpha/beta hydrolase [Fimbriimonas sp.]
MSPLLAATLLLAAQNPKPTTADFLRELPRPRDDYATRLKTWLGEKPLKDGAARQDGLDTMWVIEAPGVRNVEVVDTMSTYKLPLKRLKGTDLFAAATKLPEGTAMQWVLQLDGKPLGNPRQLEAYPVHPDMRPHAGVLKGQMIQQTPWKSQIFEGTTRDWWLYVPAQYRPDQPAAVMVFQDGQWAKGYAQNALDNLIAKGDMPVTIGIFLVPGTRADGGSNRNFEYDSLGDRYARFLLEEILPDVGKRYNLRQDAAGRAIAGNSSGGICAFNVAWERPNEFGKVLSAIGSYTNLAPGQNGSAGGHIFPSLIRKLDRKPIRVFLQDGENDVDNQFGSWWLANLQMDRALAFKGYDYRFVPGKGFHSDAHLRAILPDALRWLWRK